MLPNDPGPEALGPSADETLAREQAHEEARRAGQQGADADPTSDLVLGELLGGAIELGASWLDGARGALGDAASTLPNALSALADAGGEATGAAGVTEAAAPAAEAALDAAGEAGSGLAEAAGEVLGGLLGGLFESLGHN